MAENSNNNSLMQMLGSLDKDKIDKITKMVQNMSSEDLKNLARMLNINTNNNNS